MAEVAPFRGITYSKAKLGEGKLGLVVTEPYDKIDEPLRRAYLARHPKNGVRLILGKDDDPAEPAFAKLPAYPRARAYLDAWLKEGTLVRAERPALYVVETDFELDGKRLARRGIIARVAVSGDDVKFHERTFAGPKGDRRLLMDATDADFEQVFFLVEDPDASVAAAVVEAIRGRSPDLALSPDESRSERLWAVSEPGALARLSRALERREVTIADGHHRFEMARERWLERREAGKATEADRFRTAAIFATSDPGVAILPTHRLVRLPKSIPVDSVPERLSRELTVKKLAGDARATALKIFPSFARGMIGLYGRGLDRAHLLLARSDRDPAKLLTSLHESVRSLEVSWLHGLALDPLVGEAKHDVGDVIGYQRGIVESLDRVQKGEYDLAFILPATQVSDVVRCGKAGARMPQKSTDFYPKLLSGLVMDDKRGEA